MKWRAWCWGLGVAGHAYAWGSVGHEIVATMADALLDNDTRMHLCTYLPGMDDHGQLMPCSLASIATWADDVKVVMPWTAPWHYVNAIGDAPPHACVFGDAFTQSEHILMAIPHFVEQLAYDTAPALYFLTHLLGDLHQPLHLVGYHQGGNTLAVHYGSSQTNLHHVWDTLLLQRRIQAARHAEAMDTSYESALHGKPYDTYIRWILTEGLGLGRSIPWWPSWRTWAACFGPDKCVWEWASEVHSWACQYAMPGDLRADDPAYLEPIDRDKVVERALAMASVRLAAILTHELRRTVSR